MFLNVKYLHFSFLFKHILLSPSFEALYLNFSLNQQNSLKQFAFFKFNIPRFNVELINNFFKKNFLKKKMKKSIIRVGILLACFIFAFFSYSFIQRKISVGFKLIILLYNIIKSQIISI